MSLKASNTNLFCRSCSSSRRCSRSSSSGSCWWSSVWVWAAPTCWATWGAGWARLTTPPPCSPGWPTPTSRRRWCRVWSAESAGYSSPAPSQPLGDSLCRDQEVYTIPTYYQSMWYLYCSFFCEHYYLCCDFIHSSFSSPIILHFSPVLVWFQTMLSRTIARQVRLTRLTHEYSRCVGQNFPVTILTVNPRIIHSQQTVRFVVTKAWVNILPKA